jgi:serine/threonine protein kinase
MTTSRRTFGRYELRAALDGQGVGYRAFDPALRRDVVLHVLPSHLAADQEASRRFLATAAAIAHLRHPNVAAILDVGEAHGRPYYAAQLVDGQTLAAVLASRRLSPAQVLSLFRGLGAALDALHGAGVVHRAVTPAHVLLDRSGRVVLTGFGLPRALDLNHQDQGGPLGMAEALSPEQANGQPVGPAADVYALGVLAYQVLAGRPPFAGDAAETIYSHAHEPPPPLRSLRPGLPEHVYAAVDAALSKDPAKRPPTAGRFAEMLAAAPASLAVPPAMAPARAMVVPAPAALAAVSRQPASRAPRLGGSRTLLATACSVLVLGVVVMGGALIARGGLNESASPSTAQVRQQPADSEPTSRPAQAGSEATATPMLPMAAPPPSPAATAPPTPEPTATPMRTATPTPTPTPVPPSPTSTLTPVTASQPSALPRTQPTPRPPNLTQPAATDHRAPAPQILQVIPQTPVRVDESFVFLVIAKNHGASGRGEVVVSSPSARRLSVSMSTCPSVQEVAPGRRLPSLAGQSMARDWTVQVSPGAEWRAGAECQFLVHTVLPASGDLTLLLRMSIVGPGGQEHVWPTGSGPDLQTDQQEYSAVRWVVPVER